MFFSFSLYPPHICLFLLFSLSPYVRDFLRGVVGFFATPVFIDMFLCLSMSSLCLFLSLSMFLLPKSLCLSLSVPFGCLSLHLALFCVHKPMSPSLSATPLPGWSPSLAFSSCERLSGAGAPEATPRGAGWGLGTSARGWAAPAHRHCCCLCPAGSLYRGGSPLWATTTSGPCHSPHRATSPKAGRRHPSHPLASVGPPGQS